ncbi:MAG: CBS domain-containing protein, partial [Candidatus Nanohaloarchaea archaeon]
MNVEDMMEEDVETISADATGLEAAQAMSGEGIGSLVVVVEDGEISGIVTESDV